MIDLFFNAAHTARTYKLLPVLQTLVIAAEDRADQCAFLSFTNMHDVDLGRSVIRVTTQFFTRMEVLDRDADPADDRHSAHIVRAFESTCTLYGRLREPNAKRTLGRRAPSCIDSTAKIRDHGNLWVRPYSRFVGGATF